MTDVFLPTLCNCGFDRATIFDATRVGCGADRGWLPHEAKILIATIIEKFGEPSMVTVRETSTAPAPDQSMTPQAHHTQLAQDTTMRSNDAFPSRFFKAAVLGNKPRPVIIDRLGNEELNGEDKYILYLRGERKQLVLNKTNWEAIEELHGDSEDWTGREIERYPDKTTYQGKRVACVRVRAATKPGKSTKSATFETSENAADGFDDPVDL